MLHQCVLGVALPVLVAAVAGASPATPAAVQETEAARRQQQPQQQGGACQQAPMFLHLLCATWQGMVKAAVNLDAALRACCRGISLPQQCVAGYLLLGQFWVLAKAAALRSSAGS